MNNMKNTIYIETKEKSLLTSTIADKLKLYLLGVVFRF